MGGDTSGWNCGFSDLCNPDLALCGVVEAQSVGAVLKLQEQAEDKRPRGYLRAPRLPTVQGHWARTSVRQEVHLRGAGATTQTLSCCLGDESVDKPDIGCGRFVTRGGSR